MNSKIVWMMLTVSAPPEVLQALVLLLAEWGSGGVVEAPGAITAYFPPGAREGVEARLDCYAADLGVPVRWTWQTQEGEPWRDAWKAFFRPSRVSSRLAVCPSWEDWAPPESRVQVIRMDPGRAFGTGTHETTRLCLGLIDRLLAQDPPASEFLDVGCGSGILSVAALLLGATRAVALDLDPLAAEATLENARKNDVDERLLVVRGDLRAVRGTYPLVAANILYQVLMGLAPALCERVAPGGRLILSGVLDRELPPASALYETHGLREILRETAGEWGALVLERPRATLSSGWQAGCWPPDGRSGDLEGSSAQEGARSTRPHGRGRGLRSAARPPPGSVIADRIAGSPPRPPPGSP